MERDKIFERTERKVCFKEVQMVRSRKYKISKPYTDWECISRLVGSSMWSYSAYLDGRMPYDHIAGLHCYLMTLWAAQNAPVYAIDLDLLKAFRNTQIEDKQTILQDLEFAIPTIILLLPRGEIKTPDGSKVDYVVFHGSDTQYPQNSFGEINGLKLVQRNQDHSKHLSIGFLDSEAMGWASEVNIDSTGKVYSEPKNDLYKRTSPQDRRFLEEIRSIVFQVFLSIQYRPDLLDPLPNNAPGKPHRKSNKEKVLYPRMIGKQYRISRDLGGTHSSPQAHWRSGHWKRVCIGQGRQEREWRWFEPILVNANKLNCA